MPATSTDLDKTAELIESAGCRVITGVVDLRDLRDTETFRNDAVTEFSGLDIVCAAAGITSSGTVLDMPESDWQTMLDVNLTGVWHTICVATPRLTARSAAPWCWSVPLAIALAPHKIQVNTVHPHQHRYPDDPARARSRNVPGLG
nr:SDR family NAD(P)-dependent oxidoreductase [Mycobacteroides franklinii]